VSSSGDRVRVDEDVALVAQRETATGGSRLHWYAGLLSQAMSSATNFFAPFLVLRYGGAADVGASAVALAIYALCLSASRSLCTDALPVVYEASSRVLRNAGLRAVCGAFVLGAGIAAILGLWIAIVEGPTANYILLLALGLPFLLMQDAVRFVGFARRRTILAVGVDSLWLALQVAGTAFAVSRGLHDLAAACFAMWVLAGSIAGLAGLYVVFRARAQRERSDFFRQTRPLWVQYLTEAALTNGAPQLTLFVLAGTYGLTFAGEVRAVQVVLNPLNVVFLGLLPIAMTHLSALRRQDQTHYRKVGRRLSLAFPVTAIACTATIVAAVTLLPAVESALSPNIDVAPGLVAGALAVVGNFAQLVPFVRIRLSGSRTIGIVVRVVAGVLLVGGALLGAALGSFLGALWGIAVGTLLGSAAWHVAAVLAEAHARVERGAPQGHE
jgi:hypothetical protein